MAREVGAEGRLGGQAKLREMSGLWRDLTDNGQLHGQPPDRPGPRHRPGHHGGGQGDLTRKVTVEADGRDAPAQADREHDGRPALRVRRRGHPRGPRGRHRRQPRRPGRRCSGVSGVWKDLTDNVNLMAANLTCQVRNIAQVATAVANGDLSKKIDGRRPGRDPRAQDHPQHDGRPAARPSPTRSPAWPARSAPKATSAARPRSAASRGVWKDLTDNVNSMAAT